MMLPIDLKDKIKIKSKQLGFILAGVTTPDPPPHYSTFENWLAQNKHGTMNYLADERSRTRRVDPKQILPECKSILVLATPYSPPAAQAQSDGKIAAYAHSADYHDILPARMKELESGQEPLVYRYRSHP